MVKRGGKRRPRSLGLAVPGWTLLDYDNTSGNVLWSRPLWSGQEPVGEPGRRLKSRRYIRPAIEAIEPYRAMHWLWALPPVLRKSGASSFAFQLRFRDRDGEVHTVTSPDFYNIEGIYREQVLAQMVADVLIRAAHAHGYGGHVTALAVSLVMSADVESLARRRKGRRPPPVVKRRVSEQIRKLDPRSLRFGKRVSRRGKYYQVVKDQHGKTRGMVRWYAGVRDDLRGLLELGQSLHEGESEE